MQLRVPASLGVIWGYPGTTLVPSFTHRPRPKSHFQSDKLIQIAFLALLRAKVVSAFGCWLLDVRCWMFIPIPEAVKDPSGYESWSRFCLENLDLLLSRAAASGVVAPEPVTNR